MVENKQSKNQMNKNLNEEELDQQKELERLKKPLPQPKDYEEIEY